MDMHRIFEGLYAGALNPLVRQLRQLLLAYRQLDPAGSDQSKGQGAVIILEGLILVDSFGQQSQAVLAVT
ncbi:hypothetical protein D3C86_2141950 [compost metagenome]